MIFARATRRSTKLQRCPPCCVDSIRSSARAQLLAIAAAPKLSARAVPVARAGRRDRAPAAAVVCRSARLFEGVAPVAAPVARQSRRAVPTPGSPALISVGGPVGLGDLRRHRPGHAGAGPRHLSSQGPRRQHARGRDLVRRLDRRWRCSFNAWLFFRFGAVEALEFFQAWLIEKALSVDNLFVFLATFATSASRPSCSIGCCSGGSWAR